MTGIFLKIADLGIDAGFLIMAVIVARLLLSRAPKSAACLLWALVAVRLVVPFQVQSTFSLVPDLAALTAAATEQSAEAENSGTAKIASDSEIAQTTDETANGWGSQAVVQETQAVTSDQTPVESAGVDGTYTESTRTENEATAQNDTATGASRLLQLCTAVWLIGVAAMLGFLLVSALRLRRKTSARIRLHGNVYQCDEVDGPFILGVFHPVVCLPSGLERETMESVLRHERAHIRRRDPLWKLLGFLILSVYWFCPLCWAAYLLFCRDVEFACDERAVRSLDDAGRADYCQALLDCSRSRRLFSVCPVAFGEIGVKKRIRAIADYKKPTFWVILAAAAVCVIVAVCFFTSPRDNGTDGNAAETGTAENKAAEYSIDPEEAENAVRLTYGETTLLEEEGNAALYQNVRTLLAQRDVLEKKLMSIGDYVSEEESFTVKQENGYEDTYYRVTETDAWEFYENQALELYSTDYVTTVFTPYYIGRRIFTEEDGRLYRQNSDTPFSPILTETAQIWKLSEGGYTVTAYEGNDSGYDLYLFRMTDASDKTYGVEIMEEERYGADAEETASLFFEDLIEMVKDESWYSFVERTDADYWRGYTNFTEETENGDLYDWLISEYWFNGRPYRVQISYVPDPMETIADVLLPGGSIDSIYLYETDAGDVLLLYQSDKPDLRPDIDGFLSQSYDVFENITMDPVVLSDENGDLTLGYGNYTVDLFLGFSGSLFDYDPGIAHGESASEAWYSAGGVAVMESGKNSEPDEYDDQDFIYGADGKLSQVAILDNHMGYEFLESFETADFTGLLYEYSFDIYTIPEMEEAGLLDAAEDETISKFWVVFLDSGEDEPTYTVFFNEQCFSKEQAVSAAQSVKLK